MSANSGPSGPRMAPGTGAASRRTTGPGVWAVVVPALDEEATVTEVVGSFHALGARTVLVDNGSRDRTGDLARRAGAEVVLEPRRGYGSACLSGIEHLRRNEPPDVVAFADCDGSVAAADVDRLIATVQDGRYDLVLGRRVPAEPGALLVHQRIGNAMLMRSLAPILGRPLRDPSPIRAIRWGLLARLDLREQTYGLPIEMLVKAGRTGARIGEVSVAYYRRRGGRSKVAGSLGGTCRATAGLFAVSFRLCLTHTE
jgi:glycosyltransferase involved in cell wall biosynthesis